MFARHQKNIQNGSTDRPQYESFDPLLPGTKIFKTLRASCPISDNNEVVEKKNNE
jgi:hypothetical protein